MEASLIRRGAGSAAVVQRVPYEPPADWAKLSLLDLLGDARKIEAGQQARLALPSALPGVRALDVFCAGDRELVRRPCVAVVGSRKVSADGVKRARKLARELAANGIVVVSGLAEGVDVEAHTAAIEAGGKTIAVIGTPLDAVFPAAHKRLQETIYRDHLLVSPFQAGSKVYPSNFPQRNKIMAAITDATVIIEASDTSGTLHQAAECARLGRWLFIVRSVVEDPSLTWPKKFLGPPRTAILDRTQEIVEAIARCR